MSAERNANRVKLGIIGGSGLYEMPGLKVVEELQIQTPWGDPSDAIVIADVDGVEVAFLSRHGRGHRLLPTEVPSQANFCALRKIGVDRVLAFSAVGSLREELRPMDFAVPSQVIDRTRGRPMSYFGGGIVGHVAFADPFCPVMAGLAADAIEGMNLPGQHRDQTLVCIEGPTFSTRAESHLFRSWGAGLINMSALPEARLAREAEIAYGLVCMVTDYDCWREEEPDVDIQMILDYIRRNAENAQKLVRAVAKPMAEADLSGSPAPNASQFAVITAKEVQPSESVARLKELLPHRFEN